MKKTITIVMLCAACFVSGIGSGSAKKKPEKPVLESLEANVMPPVLGADTIGIAIEEFSTDAEVQELAQTFAKGGEDAVVSTLGRVKKGYFQMAGGHQKPIRVIQLRSEGGVRRLSIVGEAYDTIYGPGASQGFYGHRGYEFSWIEIAVNEQGNGKGLMVPFAQLVFDQQGRMKAKPMPVGTGNPMTANLVNVHSVK